jgi:branched-chain amino acid transport system permease protein
VTRLVASLFGGLTLGGTFTLMSLGLVLAFRATRTFNFAHGELMAVPAFVVGYSQAHRLPLAISFPLALVISAIIGALFYLLVLRRTLGLPLFMGIIATFGLAAILDALIGIIFTASQYPLTLPLPKGSTKIAGLGISDASLILAGLSFALAFVVAAVVRAAGQDPILASQCGIEVRRIYVVSWAAASVLAALAGISYASTALVSTSMTGLGLAALPAIVLGGMDSIEGALVGGLLVGLVESFSQTYLGGIYINVVIYSLLLVVLLVLPQGLFGSKEVVRA